MRFLMLILFLSGNFTSTQVKACSCFDTSAFNEVVPMSKTVALVKVVKYLSFKDIYNEGIPMAMEVEIIRLFKGTEERKQIVIWGDNGILCRPYLNTFKEGSFYVMALDKGNPGRGYKEEKETDYAISICGTHWLSYNNQTKIVKGAIAEKVYEIPIQKLQMYIKEAGDIIEKEPE